MFNCTNIFIPCIPRKSPDTSIPLAQTVSAIPSVALSEKSRISGSAITPAGTLRASVGKKASNVTSAMFAALDVC